MPWWNTSELRALDEVDILRRDSLATVPPGYCTISYWRPADWTVSVLEEEMIPLSKFEEDFEIPKSLLERLDFAWGAVWPLEFRADILIGGGHADLVLLPCPFRIATLDHTIRVMFTCPRYEELPAAALANVSRVTA